VGVLGFATPAFLTPARCAAVHRGGPIALHRVGMTLVIVAAGIDVRWQQMMVCGVITAGCWSSAPSPAAGRAGVGPGGGVGGHGVLIAGRVHAIIITFGTLNLFQFVGRDLRLTDGERHPAPWTCSAAASRARRRLRTASCSPRHRRRGVVVPARRRAAALLRDGADALAAELAGSGPAPCAARLRGHGALVGLAAIFTIAKGTTTLDQSIGAGEELAVIRRDHRR